MQTHIAVGDEVGGAAVRVDVAVAIVQVGKAARGWGGVVGWWCYVQRSEEHQQQHVNSGLRSRGAALLAPQPQQCMRWEGACQQQAHGTGIRHLGRTAVAEHCVLWNCTVWIPAAKHSPDAHVNVGCAAGAASRGGAVPARRVDASLQGFYHVVSSRSSEEPLRRAHLAEPRRDNMLSGTAEAAWQWAAACQQIGMTLTALPRPPHHGALQVQVVAVQLATFWEG